MSVFKLRVGSQSDVSVETIEQGVTLAQYIRSIVDSREVGVCVCAYPLLEGNVYNFKEMCFFIPFSFPPPPPPLLPLL